jgi:AcrR family transcriptional regulator
MAELPFEKISVAKIVAAANINRGTFYLHFDDKYAIVEQLEADIISGTDAIMHRFAGGHTEILTHDGILVLLSFFKDNAGAISGLLESGADLRLEAKLKNIFTQHLRFNSAGLPDVYAKEMIVSHFMSIILLWMKRGCTEPKEKIAALLHTGTMSHDWQHLYH